MTDRIDKPGEIGGTVTERMLRIADSQLDIEKRQMVMRTERAIQVEALENFASKHHKWEGLGEQLKQVNERQDKGLATESDQEILFNIMTTMSIMHSIDPEVVPTPQEMSQKAAERVGILDRRF